MNTDDAVSMTDEIGHSSGKGLEDAIIVKGHVRIELFGSNGELKDFREIDNLITTVGRNMITDRLLASPTLGVPTHMGVGTGSVAAAVGDTTLTSEVRVALTTKSRSTNVLTLVGDWAAGSATQTNSEAGVWDASSGGSLLSRVVYSGLPKGASDTLKVTWTWTIG